MPYCKNCGAEINKKAAICTKCGAWVNENPQNRTNNTKGTKEECKRKEAMNLRTDLKNFFINNLQKV